MKFLITFLASVFVLGIAFAGTVYEKSDNLTLKITTSESVIEEKEITLAELLTQKARKLEAIERNRAEYISENAKLEEELTVIEYNIAKAEELGIVEKEEVVI